MTPDLTDVNDRLASFQFTCGKHVESQAGLCILDPDYRYI
jgi:hypothetical protein